MRRARPYLLSLLVGLLLGEAALRLLGARFSTSFYVIDPDLGWALRPGVSGTYSGETVTPVRINSAGMRDDREYATGKQAGKYRVAILGDSFAEAMHVPLEHSLAQQLELHLKACHTNAEVLNFGVQGYGTAQELLVWRGKAKHYAPDTVVLLFYSGNDIYNNLRELNPTNADAAPYFTYQDASGSLIHEPALAQPSALREAWVSVVRVSMLAQFVTDAFYKLARPAVQQNRDYMDKLIYQPPGEEMRQAYANTHALIRQIRKEVEAGGAKFVLALASSGMQVHPDPQKRSDFLEFTGGDDIFFSERRIHSSARTHGMEPIFLGEMMQKEAEKTGTHYHGFAGNLGNGHWNEHGHKFAAGALGKAICK